ncbi:hypothetical protein Tco_1113978 [Tanacetum coccineum]|uniref:Uncharacterized protein n=1 Tax=Tanacetum coccineum TaxID=301880 RepID=A0ABQ5IV99_9ASTR
MPRVSCLAFFQSTAAKTKLGVSIGVGWLLRLQGFLDAVGQLIAGKPRLELKKLFLDRGYFVGIRATDYQL